MARKALAIGKSDLAARIALQILHQDPRQAEASLVLAAAQSRLGNAPEAAGAGRLAYRLSQSGDARFEAAFLTASALAAQDRPSWAKWWLRRAHDHIQSESDARLLRRAFSNLDHRTPAKLTLQFSGGPTNNANGGSLHDTFWLDGIIPIPITQALPGFAAQGQAKLSYRLSEGARHSLSIFGAFSGRMVWLNDQARTLDPTARNRDFASVGLDLGLSYRRALSDGLALAIEGQIGHQWYGQGRSSNRQQLKFALDKALQGDRLLSVALTAAAAQRPDAPSSDTLSLAVEAEHWMPLGNGAVSARLGYARVMADARGVAWRGPSAGANWQVPPVLGGVDLGLFGALQVKDFWKTASQADLSVELGASARLKRLSVMGFAPTLSLSTSRNFSDVVVRDTADTNLSLGLSSVF